MGDLIELEVPATERFEFFSKSVELVKAYEEGGRKLFRGVASSTTKDLHGDTITLSGLQDMEKQAVGLTMFLNHSYDVPDDVGGTITKAIVRQKGVDEKGDPNYQLEIEGEVEEDNPAALQTWTFVKKGRKLGLSIGAMIPKGGAVRQKDGSYLIEHVQLLEVSFVGIPANPKSWVEYAASAIRGIMSKQTHTLSNPTLTLKDGRYIIEGPLDGLDLHLGGEPEEVTTIEHSFDVDANGAVEIKRTTTKGGETETELLGAWDLADADDRIAAIATAGEDAVQKATVWVETRDGDKITIGEPAVDDVSASVDPDTTKAMCPSCGKGRDASGCSDSYHKAAPDPDVQDAKVRVIEIDTSEPSSGGDGQGASSDSEPADDTLAAPEADVTANTEPVILDDLPADELLKLSFGQLQSIALRAVNELVAAKRALAEEKQARKNAEDAVAKAMDLVRRTNGVLEKVANAPLARKAIVKDVKRELDSSIAGYYGEDMARALRGDS